MKKEDVKVGMHVYIMNLDRCTDDPWKGHNLYLDNENLIGMRGEITETFVDNGMLSTVQFGVEVLGHKEDVKGQKHWYFFPNNMKSVDAMHGVHSNVNWDDYPEVKCKNCKKIIGLAYKNALSGNLVFCSDVCVDAYHVQGVE